MILGYMRRDHIPMLGHQYLYAKQGKCEWEEAQLGIMAEMEYQPDPNAICKDIPKTNSITEIEA